MVQAWTRTRSGVATHGVGALYATATRAGASEANAVRRCRAAMPGCSDADVVATATMLTARSIADSYRRFMPEPVTETLLSGGGAKNRTLVEWVAKLVAPIRVRSFDDVFFDGEAKEAVAFALLAKRFMDGLPGNVPTATGAAGPRILGKLTPAGESPRGAREKRR